jgi:hypothetical protein
MLLSMMSHAVAHHPPAIESDEVDETIGEKPSGSPPPASDDVVDGDEKNTVEENDTTAENDVEDEESPSLDASKTEIEIDSSRKNKRKNFKPRSINYVLDEEDVRPSTSEACPMDLSVGNEDDDEEEKSDDEENGSVMDLSVASSEGRLGGPSPRPSTFSAFPLNSPRFMPSMMSAFTFPPIDRHAQQQKPGSDGDENEDDDDDEEDAFGKPTDDDDDDDDRGVSSHSSTAASFAENTMHELLRLYGIGDTAAAEALMATARAGMTSGEFTSHTDKALNFIHLVETLNFSLQNPFSHLEEYCF